MEYDIIIKKLFGFAIILLFLRADVIPSTGMVFNDDTTPPVTIYTLDPPEPDGDNGWYVSDVNVTLNATDDMSGVKEIKYTIDGAGGIITGDIGSFMIKDDGDNIFVEYWAIDNVGNIEAKKSFNIDIDQTTPEIDPEGVHWEVYQTEPSEDWYIRFWTNATDATSGMDQVIMYINDGLHEVNSSPYGAYYEFILKWSTAFETAIFKFEHYDNAGNMIEDCIDGGPIEYKSSILGLICNPKIVNQSITFFAIIVAYSFPCPCGGHSISYIYRFKQITITKSYDGYIGRFFICVSFDTY